MKPPLEIRIFEDGNASDIGDEKRKRAEDHRPLRHHVMEKAVIGEMVFEDITEKQETQEVGRFENNQADPEPKQFPPPGSTVGHYPGPVQNDQQQAVAGLHHFHDGVGKIEKKPLPVNRHVHPEQQRFRPGGRQSRGKGGDVNGRDGRQYQP